MKFGRVAMVAAMAALAGQAAGQTSGQKVTGPVAVYWMSASTTSGMGAMGAGGPGGGQRPGLGAMMGGMMGGGGFGGMDANAYSHGLILQLGSTRRPQSGDPQAEHDPPQVLGAGPVLPLLTPVKPAYVESEPGPPAKFQQPKGRMLIFWGCGEHAGPGQPLVIDFSKIGPQGQGAGQFAALSHGLGISPMQPPSPERYATYGEWPNEKSRTHVPPDGSLQGAHLVRGNYSPDINFQLTADQDFLPPIQLKTNVKNPSGSASLGWGQVDGSRGYIASMFGSPGNGDMVMWTSSAVQATAFALPDYLSDHEIARLVAEHVLMPPTQTACTVPQEAVRAAQQGMFKLVAYGGESNFSYPPRPPAPKTWNIDWTVKVRYRAETGGLLGMSMPGMDEGRGGGRNHYPENDGEGGDDRSNQPQQQQQQQQQQHRPNPFNPFGGGLGGFIP
jgi:hypothetical protein